MYGETITLELGSSIKIEVFVFCSPDMSYEKKKQMALKKIGKVIISSDVGLFNGLTNEDILEHITKLTKNLALDNFSNGYNSGYERGRSDEYKEAMDAFRERG